MKMSKDNLKKELIDLLRQNSRSNLTKFSKKKEISTKKVHYEYNKLKENVEKFVPVIDFEALGFKRIIIIFHKALEGIKYSTNKNNFFVNNSTRLDRGLIVEYIFFLETEQEKFLKE